MGTTGGLGLGVFEVDFLTLSLAAVDLIIFGESSAATNRLGGCLDRAGRDMRTTSQSIKVIAGILLL